MRINRLSAALALAVAAAASTARAAILLNTVGTYDEQTTQTNAVDTSATAAPNDVTTFATAVGTAFAANLGGVINFDIAANNTDTTLSALYGTSQAKTLTITSSKTLSLQTVTSSTSISGTRVALLASNTTGAGGNDFTLTFGPVAGGLPGEAVTAVGLTALSRNTAGYPASVTVTANFSSGGSQSSTFNLASALGTNDTFVGFRAPAGTSISSLAFDLPDAVSTPTATDTRLLFDDLGFTTAVTPEPSSAALLGLPALAFLARRRRR